MHPPLAYVSASQALLTMMFVVAVLVTLRILAARNPDEDGNEADAIPPVVTFECESCGEDLKADDAPCPMCGGRVLRMETPAEAWSSGGDVRGSR